MGSKYFREFATAVYDEFKDRDQPRYPLSSELQQAIRLYLSKNAEPTDSDSQRLHGELRNVFERHVRSNLPTRLAPFLALLRELRALVRGFERSTDWWAVVLYPTIDTDLMRINDISDEIKSLLLSFLIVPDDDGEDRRVAIIYAKRIFDVFVDRSARAEPKEDGARDQESMMILSQLESILILFGKSKPKEFLRALDAIFLIKAHRLASLDLLSQFVTSQPPQMHKILETPLLNHLISSLMYDRSPSIIALSLQSLMMFLPHIPAHVVPYLPQLFIIYNRLLCWDIYYPEPDLELQEDGKSPPSGPNQVPKHHGWDTMDTAAESYAAQPEILHYWTILYGLYPLNLAAFIRAPNEYLQMSNWGRTDESGLDKILLANRSRKFANMHLVHPNFLTLTADDELKDISRWKDRDPASVSTDCFILASTSLVNARSQYSHLGTRPVSTIDGRDSRVPTEDIPWDSLAAYGDDSSTVVASSTSMNLKSPGIEGSGIGIAMDRRSIYDPRRTVVLRGYSYSRSHRPTSQFSVESRTQANSISQAGPAGADSPTIPGRGSMQSDTRSHSLVGQKITALEPNGEDASRNIGEQADAPPVGQSESELYRQVVQLRNELNLERYIKDQHISYNQQLRRKQINDSRAEAEMRAYKNNLKLMKQKLVETRDAYSLLKQDLVRSRTNHKKLEAEYLMKFREMRQRARSKSDLQAQQDTTASAEEVAHLKQIIADKETDRSRLYESNRALEATALQAEKAKDRVEELEWLAQEYQKKTTELDHALEHIDELEVSMEKTRLRAQAREGDLERTISSLKNQVRDVSHQARPRPGESRPEDKAQVRAMIESATAASNQKTERMRKRYERAEQRILDLQDQLHKMAQTVSKLQYNADFRGRDEPLHFEDNGPNLNDSSIHSQSQDRLSGPSIAASSHSNEGLRGRIQSAPETSVGLTQAASNYRLDDQIESDMNDLSPLPLRVRSQREAPVPMANQAIARERPATGATTGTFSSHDDTATAIKVKNIDTDKDGEKKRDGSRTMKPIKITPKSEVRVYGRGGGQNIGRSAKSAKKSAEKAKLKAARDAAAEKQEGSDTGATKSASKLAGLFSSS